MDWLNAIGNAATRVTENVAAIRTATNGSAPAPAATPAPASSSLFSSRNLMIAGAVIGVAVIAFVFLRRK